MYIAYIGIGSNLGNREDNCEKAISLLSENGLNIIKKSSMIETEPWGVLDQPAFINMAVSVNTILSPEKLLALCKKIETDVGRTETIMWGPRIIDLDILFYDDLVMEKLRPVYPPPSHKRQRFYT